MKLKPIAFAIIAAGMVAPSFAAYVSTPAPKKVCGMPVGMSSSQAIITGNSYNSGVESSVCWFDRIRFSGSLDVGYRNVTGEAYSGDNIYNTRSPEGGLSDIHATGWFWAGGGSKSTHRILDLHQIILAADAKLHQNWDAKVVMRYGFENTPVDYRSLVTIADIGGAWTVEEAYVTYSDPATSPVFLKAGKGFVPYGNYSDPFEFTPTIMQSLSQLNESYLQLGVVGANGWHASVSGWTSSSTTSSSADPGDWQYAFDMGLTRSMMGMNLDFDASYIANFNEVISNRSFTHLAEAGSATKDRAWQVGLATNISGFDVGARYMNINTTNTQNIWGGHLGYMTNLAGHDNSLVFDYESANSAATPLDSRWSLGWIMGISDNVDAEFKYVSFSSQQRVITDPVPAADPTLWTITITGRF